MTDRIRALLSAPSLCSGEMDEIREAFRDLQQQVNAPVRPLSVRTCPHPYPEVPHAKTLEIEANGNAWFRQRPADDGRKMVIRWCDVSVIDRSLPGAMGIVACNFGRTSDAEEQESRTEHDELIAERDAWKQRCEEARELAQSMALREHEHSAAHREVGDPLSVYRCQESCQCQCPLCAYERGFKAGYGKPCPGGLPPADRFKPPRRKRIGGNADFWNG